MRNSMSAGDGGDPVLDPFGSMPEHVVRQFVSFKLLFEVLNPWFCVRGPLVVSLIIATRGTRRT